MILGYKSPQKFFERANMCPGRQKKTSPCTWENTPPVRKHTATWGILPRFRTPKAGVPDGGDKAPLPLFKGPGPEKQRGLRAWESTHPGEETRVRLMSLHA